MIKWDTMKPKFCKYSFFLGVFSITVLYFLVKCA